MLNTPVSHGEVLDKISILSLKLEKIKDVEKLKNVENEYRVLMEIGGESIKAAPAAYCDLLTINNRLWDVEDKIRDHERDQNFGPEFVGLARSVYKLNDERCRIKRQINQIFDSGIIEEKSYKPY